LEWAPDFGTDVDIRGEYSSLPALPALRSVLSYDVQLPSILVLVKITQRLTWLEFEIQENWKYLYDFFLLLGDLCHLRNLQLELTYIEGIFSFPVNRLAKTGVQYLRLSCRTMGFISDAAEKNTSFTNQETLLSAFSTCFPGVRRLELIYTFYGPQAAVCIQSATHLLSLALHNVEVVPNHYDVPIKSLTLEVIILRLNHALAFSVPIIECPSISTLEVVEREGRWDGSRIRHNNVTHLRIGKHKTPLGNGQVQWVAKLRVNTTYYADYNANEVLIFFICEPARCPLLVELELGFIPEWDLLFLILERRNYLPQSQHISRIETLLLPFPPPPQLLLPLTEILAGRFTVRPPNGDISVSSFREAYFDRNMWVSIFRLY